MVAVARRICLRRFCKQRRHVPCTTVPPCIIGMPDWRSDILSQHHKANQPLLFRIPRSRLSPRSHSLTMTYAHDILGVIASNPGKLLFVQICIIYMEVAWRTVLGYIRSWNGPSYQLDRSWYVICDSFLVYFVLVDYDNQVSGLISTS